MKWRGRRGWKVEGNVKEEKILEFDTRTERYILTLVSVTILVVDAPMTTSVILVFFAQLKSKRVHKVQKRWENADAREEPVEELGGDFEAAPGAILTENARRQANS